MNHNITLIVSVFISLVFIVMMAPQVLAMNRGKVLRNIAIWLAVFAVLGFVYKVFGPESEHPLIKNSVITQQPQQKHEEKPSVEPKKPQTDAVPGALPKDSEL